MGKEQESSKKAPSLVCVPTSGATEGALVLQEVVQLTGLPSEYLDSEITNFLGTTGESVNDMTLDQLRSVLMNYLETINQEMIEEENKH